MTQCKEGAQKEGLMLDTHEELYKWFTSQVIRNLHVVFTMNPSSEGLKDRAATSPALFNRYRHLEWMIVINVRKKKTALSFRVYWKHSSASGVCWTGLETGPQRPYIRWVRSSPARWIWRSPTTKCQTTCPSSTTNCPSHHLTEKLSSMAVCLYIRHFIR